MTPEEIALNFSERFQKNYPKEPLWEMMDDLSNEIKYYASSMCKRQREICADNAFIVDKFDLAEIMDEGQKEAMLRLKSRIKSAQLATEEVRG